MSNKKYIGEVIFFKTKEGWGFIEWEGEEDIFVHFSGIASEGFKNLKKGEKVEFELGKNNKDEIVAINVKVI